MDESDAFNWFYYVCQRALSYVREPHIQGQDRRRARRIFHDYLRTIARKRQLKRVQFGVASAAAHKAIWSWIKFAQNIFMYNFHRAQLWSLRCEKFNFRSEQVHCTDFHLRCCSDISHTVWACISHIYNWFWCWIQRDTRHIQWETDSARCMTQVQ